jgi:hypothetical protein
MRKEVAGYVAKYSICQQVKVEHRKPAGLLQPLPIPEWKWEMITMDFVSGLPIGKRGNDAIWVIVDRLTKSALFLLVKMTDPVDKLASWSSNINCFRPRPKIYFTSLVEHTTCLGNKFEYQYCLSSAD